MIAIDKLRQIPIPIYNSDLKVEKTALSTVFAQREGSYINELMLFVAHFNTIPNFINEIDINCIKACEWFADNYKNDIKNLYYDRIYFRQKKQAQYDDVFFFVYEDLIVDFDTNQSIVRFLFRQTPREKVDDIVQKIIKFKYKRTSRNPEVSLLVNSVRGIDTKSLKIGRTKLSIEDNYNDDFLEIHRLILKRLSKPNDKGLVLLHGKPGTGKTSYIRYLISRVRKNVIFLPPSMAGAITNPELISILIDNPNSIFVIEDAENIVVDREQDGHSPVSALLNISDGLLSDCLNIQLICSFNTDLSKVDKALMRKGRMIAKYEFRELDTHKAQKLSDKLGYNTLLSTPMTLSAIYNQGEANFEQPQKIRTIGFNNAIKTA